LGYFNISHNLTDLLKNYLTAWCCYYAIKK
jgi:hypothetical protein